MQRPGAWHESGQTSSYGQQAISAGSSLQRPGSNPAERDVFVGPAVVTALPTHLLVINGHNLAGFTVDA